MTDLFGPWIPREWVETVLEAVRDNPQWNFIFLTKFPERIAEFDIPKNAWMGTTVDRQSRVRNAEEAFASFECPVKWLAVEPMLEPLQFKRIDLFNWLVIGGATKSKRSPEWKPPYSWHADLTKQATEVGVKVYHQTNLLGARRLELPY